MVGEHACVWCKPSVAIAAAECWMVKETRQEDMIVIKYRGVASSR